MTKEKPLAEGTCILVPEGVNGLSFEFHAHTKRRRARRVEEGLDERWKIAGL